MQQVHPPYSSPDLVAAPVESVVESGQAVLVAHVLSVNTAQEARMHHCTKMRGLYMIAQRDVGQKGFSSPDCRN
jgi:predicted alpha/beta hydrolase family esterase